MGTYLANFSIALLNAIIATSVAWPVFVQNVAWASVGFCGAFVLVKFVESRP